MSKFNVPMNTKIRSFAFCLTACLLACSQSWAQRGPQDTWYETSRVAMPSGCNPQDLIVTPEGTLLLSDAGNHKIHELDENGSLLNSFGSLGSANGQFNNPLEMVLSSQNKIYVADQNNHRVQVLERNGTFVKTFGTNGTGDGQFNKPWGLAISSENEVFVVDKVNNRIQVFDENGTFLRKWGSAGSLDGQFNAPHGLAFTPSDLLLTVDTNNNRLVSFDTNGNHIGKFALYRHYDFYRGSHFVSYLPTGLIFIGGGNDGPSGSQNYANIYDQTGNSIKRN
jgi:hypothetical protein